ncbi:hypothetical protein AB0J86_16215 [Micromonospora sp. NPDC049559]|uniref:hypothetical protein n=1 Tax=Micromonospora sp. NPDC049559 TaxID=3155923 RepID=UPI003421ACEE
MSSSTPGVDSARRLVWASDEVIARIEQEVRPQVSLPRMIALAATSAFVFTWLPAFVVFAATTIVAPSLTNEASVGTAAFWALQVSMLVAITAAVTTVRRRAAKLGGAGTDASTQGTLLRVAIHILLTGACAWLVLALQGLSISQIASLTAVLVVVLHLVPVIGARLLRGIRGRRGPSLSDPVS